MLIRSCRPAVKEEYEFDIGSVMVGQLHQEHAAILDDGVANKLSQMASIFPRLLFPPPLLHLSLIIFLIEEVVGEERERSEWHTEGLRWKVILQQVWPFSVVVPTWSQATLLLNCMFAEEKLCFPSPMCCWKKSCGYFWHCYFLSCRSSLMSGINRIKWFLFLLN